MWSSLRPCVLSRSEIGGMRPGSSLKSQDVSGVFEYYEIWVTIRILANLTCIRGLRGVKLVV